ncbi:MAG: ferrous iron transport protein B [Spirochaetes bacterium GWD1_27_9]|nr:MAG: ferrous iron transport protein B [Spirochaetes bacterium GWB1_27_13]OHD25666.1 MAG: ferrous iron transport protein B [Spirochaetes bacterium GWC1_27_15]OHD41599.1 MAG: ferrous iron transport protein B [Spirochaetes bacterium GWD1_27_9]
MLKHNLNIAIIGQPNSGKTSLFNKLTGSNQHVGNWAGVTVEKKEGKFSVGKQKINAIDLPGIYSLSTYTLEEKVTRNYLINERPNLILNIVDATNLERQLFLTMQLLFIGIPTILVLNMIDEVEEKGNKIDTKRLSELLGVQIVETVARDAKGIDNLKQKINEYLNNSTKNKEFKIPDDEANIIQTIRLFSKEFDNIDKFKDYKNWYALKFLEKDIEVSEEIKKHSTEVYGLLDLARKELTKSISTDLAIAIPDWIYGITRGIEAEVLKEFMRKKQVKEIVSNFLDLIALDKFFGVPVFFLVMFLLFQATFFVGDILIGYMENLLAFLSHFITYIPNKLIVSLLKDGIVGGVGNVLLLIPYIFIMFFLMSILDDSGYMSRAAFVMDRFMHKIGLHGKSFIPLIMGFGCNVPAIMAARTLESHEEKIKTILMVPFIACSARLPVFVLLSGAFFGKYGGISVFALYMIGILISILTGIILNKTVLKKKSDGLIMELPPYRTPHILNSITGTLPKIKHYFIKAGTIIFVASAILWVLSYFPVGVEFGGEHSLIGRLGKIISIIFIPLGFDWKMTVGLITGVVAKEVVISTLSVLYSASDSFTVVLPTLINPIIGFSYLAFILIYTPCLATIAVIKSETNSTKWAIISLVYSITLAWIVSFLISNVGGLIFKFISTSPH